MRNHRLLEMSGVRCWWRVRAGGPSRGRESERDAPGRPAEASGAEHVLGGSGSSRGPGGRRDGAGGRSRGTEPGYARQLGRLVFASERRGPVSGTRLVPGWLLLATVPDPRILNPATPPTRPPLQSVQNCRPEGTSHPHCKTTQSTVCGAETFLRPVARAVCCLHSDGKGRVGTSKPSRTLRI